MSDRFSKRAVLAAIERRCDTYANGFQSAAGRRIDPTNGWVQCVDQGVEAAVNYGHWKALRDLADAIRAGFIAEAGSLARRKPVPLDPPLGVVRVEVAPEVALVFTAPIHIIPETNQREHWGAKARRVKAQRSAATMLTRLALAKLLPMLPATVTLTRIIGYRGRPLDEGDNLPAAFKAIRDGIADALQVNDGDKTRVRWEYAPEERGADWAIRIRIERMKP